MWRSRARNERRLTLSLISGSKPPDTKKERSRQRIRATAVISLLQCHRCGGREMIEAKTGMQSCDGKATGGTKSILCTACLMRGERVVVI